MAIRVRESRDLIGARDLIGRGPARGEFFELIGRMSLLATLASAFAVGPGCGDAKETTTSAAPSVSAASPDEGKADGDAAEADDGSAAEAELRIETFALRSEKLAAFAGEPVEIIGTLVLPPKWSPEGRYPVNYVVHGFGGSHKQAAMSHGSKVWQLEKDGVGGPVIHVYLDANHPMGHHVFADSANMGPWGTALVEEYIPALEAKFGGAAVPHGRFVSGHSSGGWSSLWLQVDHPDFFGGVWSTAPDPVDFRHFTGIDVYAWDNMYRDPDGKPVMLMRKGEEFVLSFEEYTRKEVKTKPIGGQIYSFDAVFSPKGEDGQPKFIFDRETGVIDHSISDAWRAFDIRQKLEAEWAELGPKLAGKIHITVGTLDTFRLDGAVRLLDAALDGLGSDAQIVYVEGRSHFDLFDPDAELYPQGYRARALEEMWKAWEAGEAGDAGQADDAAAAAQ